VLINLSDAQSRSAPVTSSKETNVPTIAARGLLKVTAVLDPAALVDLAVPNGIPRIILHITAGEARYTVDLNAKRARRAIAMIRELGPENVTAIVEGRLVGNAIIEAGLMVQPRPAQAELTPAPAAT
jgi:hypothetical protein